MLTRSGTKSTKEMLSPKNSSSSDLDKSGDRDDDIDDEVSDEDDDDNERKNDPSDDKLFIALGLQYEVGKYSKGDIVVLKEKLGDFFGDAYEEAKK
jgi:hypothetical protein